MTYQPIPQQRPVPQPQQPVPTLAKPKRFGFVALGVTGVAGLFLGGMIGASTAATTAAPAPTVTVTAPAPEPTEAAPEPTMEEPEPAVYVPKKSDWQVKVTTRKKQCFGEAGCNVTVKTEPIYVGDRDLPDTGTIEVFYEISGDESGPITESFTVTGGTAHYPKEEDLSTPKSGTKVKAKITDVTYEE